MSHPTGMYSTIRVDKKTIVRLRLLMGLSEEDDRAKVIAQLIEQEIAKLQAWAIALRELAADATREEDPS